MTVGFTGRRERSRLAVFDYGAGNLHSLVKAIARDDREISIETDLRAAISTDLLVLPGVGAFGAAARAMEDGRSSLASALGDGLPCLGICLGMQLLFDASEEGPGEGVGFIAGNVIRLRTPTVPHMGWNEVNWRGDDGASFSQLQTAYFANAYICQPDDDSVVRASTTHQDTTFAAVVRRGNTVGVQFHPEKSSSAGRAFINTVIEVLLDSERVIESARESVSCK